MKDRVNLVGVSYIWSKKEILPGQHFFLNAFSISESKHSSSDVVQLAAIVDEM